MSRAHFSKVITDGQQQSSIMECLVSFIVSPLVDLKTEKASELAKPTVYPLLNDNYIREFFEIIDKVEQNSTISTNEMISVGNSQAKAGPRIDLKKIDLDILHQNNWLNNNHMNAYMFLLTNQAQNARDARRLVLLGEN